MNAHLSPTLPGQHLALSSPQGEKCHLKLLTFNEKQYLGQGDDSALNIIIFF
jgi:hypothetical protein